MQYSQAQRGRTFVLRLEDGETVHEEIERFAREQGITAAALIIIGGAAGESRLVVGPERGDARPVTPATHILGDVHEVAGTGTIFPDDEGAPVVHLHMACGRGDNTVTGCIRAGIKVWQIMEIVLFELTDTTGQRLFQPDLGFKVLQL
ncbi:MAG: DNA-binding protein [Deltaproteobacteria bacterium]|nr:DNA-binding protein [Deltaproteobacteria bacterium]